MDGWMEDRQIESERDREDEGHTGESVGSGRFGESEGGGRFGESEGSGRFGAAPTLAFALTPVGIRCLQGSYHPSGTLPPLWYPTTPLVPYHPSGTLPPLWYSTTPLVLYQPSGTLPPLWYSTTPLVSYHPGPWTRTGGKRRREGLHPGLWSLSTRSSKPSILRIRAPLLLRCPRALWVHSGVAGRDGDG